MHVSYRLYTLVGVPGVAESHAPAGLKVVHGEGSMAWHGNMEPRRPKPKPSTETKNHVPPKASLKCKWNWVPCRVGIDEWRCGCRHGITRHVAMMMREAASCGYGYTSCG